MTLFHFLHGQKPSTQDVICVYLLGGLSGVLVLLQFSPLELKHWVLAFLAADITGGIISNATESTRKQWAIQNSKAHYTFLVLHLLVHPIIIYGLNGISNAISISMFIGLLAKVTLFWGGRSLYSEGE
jgi:hypothetical protein